MRTKKKVCNSIFRTYCPLGGGFGPAEVAVVGDLGGAAADADELSSTATFGTIDGTTAVFQSLPFSIVIAIN